VKAFWPSALPKIAHTRLLIGEPFAEPPQGLGKGWSHLSISRLYEPENLSQGDKHYRINLLWFFLKLQFILFSSVAGVVLAGGADLELANELIALVDTDGEFVAEVGLAVLLGQWRGSLRKRRESN
jgi:hypothetical protein